MPLLPHWMTATQPCWDERAAQLQCVVHPPDSNGLWIWQACWGWSKACARMQKFAQGSTAEEAHREVVDPTGPDEGCKLWRSVIQKFMRSCKGKLHNLQMQVVT